MAVTLDIKAIQSDNGKKITINDISEDRSTNVTDITSVTFAVSKYDYETNSYESIGYATITEDSYTSQDDMEYYIEANGTSLIISSKSNPDTYETIGAYAEDVIKDGIWQIDYNTSAETTAQTFLFHYNYESKLAVYNLHRDLPSHFLQDQIKYDKNVEAALLRKAFLNSLNYSAEFGQLEIIEEIDLLLRDLLNND